jgi:hypothetical protein
MPKKGILNASRVGSLQLLQKRNAPDADPVGTVSLFFTTPFASLEYKNKIQKRAIGIPRFPLGALPGNGREGFVLSPRTMIVRSGVLSPLQQRLERRYYTRKRAHTQGSSGASEA